MSCDLDEEIKKNPHNYPYIAMISGDSSLQFFQIAERIVVGESENLIGSLTDLIYVYFTYNIQYPKALYPILLSIQRYILNIDDSQPIPPALTRVLSALQSSSLQLLKVYVSSMDAYLVYSYFIYLHACTCMYTCIYCTVTKLYCFVAPTPLLKLCNKCRL